MIPSYTELLNLNIFDSNLEQLKFYTVISTRPDLKITGRQKVHYFSQYELKQIHEWKYEDFDYDISELGFRDAELPKEIDIAAFGCSFTFGQALPLHRTWPKLLAKNCNLTCYNFGLPGASTKTIVDIFSILTQHVKIKKAIFLLPVYARQLVAAVGKKANERILLPVIPSYKGSLQLNYDIDVDSYYKYVPDQELIKNFKDALFLIEFLGKIKGIEIFFSAWDRNTYQVIENINFKYAKKLPEWDAGKVNDYQTDFARDRQHPGIRHHESWASQVQRYITS